MERQPSADPTIDAGAGALRFGAIRLASGVTSETVLTSDRSAVATAIQNLSYSGGWTHTHEGLVVAMNRFGARSTTPNKVIPTTPFHRSNGRNPPSPRGLPGILDRALQHLGGVSS
jgi:hypothetical protein